VALAFSSIGAVVDPAAARPYRSHHAAQHQQRHHHRAVEWPLEIPGSQYAPVKWSEVTGWSADDQFAAFKTFRASCVPILAAKPGRANGKAIGDSLREPCRAAKAAHVADSAAARAFFEREFVPLRISRIGEDAGFVTG
jgi:membrane-bound lytic murein transglycosylase A